MPDDDNRSDKPVGEVLTEAELAARKARLDAALKTRQRQREDAEKPKSGTSMAGYAAAFRLSTEFIAGIVVGALIGWLIDQFAGTSPFAMIVFLMLGFVAGVFNVLRAAGLMADPHARLPGRTLAEKRRAESGHGDNPGGSTGDKRGGGRPDGDDAGGGDGGD